MISATHPMNNKRQNAAKHIGITTQNTISHHRISYKIYVYIYTTIYVYSYVYIYIHM